MNNKNTAKIATSGFFWTFSERICAQLVALIVSVVLARLLTPGEYSIVAIVNIFITFSQVFVTSGFGNALIQKVDADETDFSTTLAFSLLFSGGLYVILFFSAPVIASAYEIALLTPVIRVMGIKLFFLAFNTVQHAFISKKLAFKKFFYSTFIGTAVSAVIGIWAAYAGVGVWALVAQDLSNAIIHSIVLFFTCGWKIRWQVDFSRVKPLFSYGWKILASDLLGTLYFQLQGFVLSFAASPVSLSYYNQGEKYPALFINNIEASLHKVMFPILSKEQADIERIKILTRKALSLCMTLIFPCMLGLFVCAPNLIRVLLTEKWLPCVPYLQIICLAYLLNPIMSAHTRVMKAMGKSGTFLKLTFLRYGCAFLFLGIVLLRTNNAYFITAISVLVMVIICLVCAYISKKNIGYTYREQVADLSRSALISLFMAIVVFVVGQLTLPPLALLALQLSLGVLVYLLLSLLFNRETVRICFSVLASFKRK